MAGSHCGGHRRERPLVAPYGTEQQTSCLHHRGKPVWTTADVAYSDISPRTAQRSSDPTELPAVPAACR